ncbi:MAG: alpha/beta hydrolase [Chitinophagia bacterium]|nr:alpha/beta hydrolase [Chitinophagia bacterium]
MTKNLTYVLICTFWMLTISSCAFKIVNRTKDITYLKADSTRNIAEQKLNVFAPRKKGKSKDVFIFVYGGTWNSGHKSLYNFLGNRMARKNVVTVILDYPKSPAATYDLMAEDVAKSVKWVKDNIENYGGDPNKIYISGHSAGGHLSALISVRNDYFDKLGIVNPIKGTILIDAAGIDMYSYMMESKFPEGNTFINTFTNNPVAWKDASPIYHLNKAIPPMLIYVGEKTYPSISKGNDLLVSELHKLNRDPIFYNLKGKKHKPMITQFLNSYNHRYKEIKDFMRKNDGGNQK